MPDQRKKKKNAPQGYIPAPGDQPRTGEQVQVEERNIPHFKTGKQLHELLNPKK